MITEAAGLPNFRAYDLRHLHASVLQDAGVPVTAMSERLGHYDPGFTLSVYSHTPPGTQGSTAAISEEALFGKDEGEDEAAAVN